MKKVSLLCRLIVLLAAFAFPAEMLADDSTDNYKSATSVSTNETANGKAFTKKRGATDTFYREITFSNYKDVDNIDLTFKVTDNNGNEYHLGYYATDPTNNPTSDITDFTGTQKYLCSTAGDQKFTLNINALREKYNKCTLTLTFNNIRGDHQYWYVTVKGTEVAPGAVFDDAYYFVSPQLTKNPVNPESLLCESFRFSPSRQRGGGLELGEYQTFNFRDFLIDKNLDEIEYWIQRGDGKVVYKAYQETYELGKDKPGTDNLRGNILNHEAYDCANDHKGVFKLKRGTGQSYTFFINTQPNSQNKRTLEIIVNDKNLGRREIDENGYYLVGNFKKAAADIDIKPNEIDGRREMRKSWFKGGIEYLDPTEDIKSSADSILFRVTIPKPAEGWNQLYLAVFAAEDIKNWGNYDINVAWGKAIRPQVQWIYKDDSYGLDGTALHGGLTTRRADATLYTQQALNPQVDDSYTSYTFSMNITTSTYNLVFNKGMYIMGPAVTATEEESNDADTEGWSIADADHQTKHALRMYYNRDSRNYTYHGKPDAGETTEGMLAKKEQPIYIKAGEPFLFVYNKDFTKTIFMGDRVSPKSLVIKDKNGVYCSDEMNVYGLATNDNDNNNHDTQYVNYLRTGSTSSTTYNPDFVRTCDFGLPSGYYYIRLYIRQDEDIQKIYYLLNRAYTFYRPYADKIEDKTEYDTFKSFCDYHAVLVPEDIAIFYVSEARQADMEAVLTPYTAEKTADGRQILPAGMPVILAKKYAGKEEGNKLLTEDIVMEYYEEPNYGRDKHVKNNLLKGQIERKHITLHDAEKTVTNYLFGYKKRNGSDKPATIGFYQPGEGDCSINTAYLQVPGNISPTAASKGWRMVFDGGATDVSSIEAASAEADNSYYTLQGMKIARPTTKGIYIHNNKKIIIK